MVDPHIQRITLELKNYDTVTQQVSHRPIECQSRSWSQRGTKVNGSRHGDNSLLKPTGIQIATKSLPGFTTLKKTYRRQEYVFGYELQLLLSGVLPILQKLNYKLQRTLSERDAHLPKYQTHQKGLKMFSSYRRVTRRQFMRDFTRDGTDQCQNGSSNLLTRFREQPRMNTSDCCRLPTASVFSNKADKSRSNHF